MKPSFILGAPQFEITSAALATAFGIIVRFKDGIAQSASLLMSLGCCRRAALAVAVGSIVRSKGGIALQSTLNLTAGTLLAAAQLCPGPAQLWLLHGMWLIVNSAGPAFLPHVIVSATQKSGPATFFKSEINLS